MEDRLQKFAKVVETGSITKAAKELRISQPALSTAIHKLERELKTELIAQNGRAISITAAGHLVYGTASAVRAKLQDLTQELTQLRQQKPQISIGMIDSLAELLCSKGSLLQQLEATANTSLTVHNSSYLMHAVEQGKLDVALVAWQSHSTGRLQITPLGNEPLTMVTQSDGLVGVQAQVQQGSIPNFLAYNPSSNTFQLIAQHLVDNGLRADIIFHSTSPEVILQLVLAGRGVAALPFQMVREQLERGALAQISAGNISRPIVAVQEKGRAFSANVDTCLSQARQALTQLAEAE
jgi:DNA-binding transcriptional LysR family regulator